MDSAEKKMIENIQKKFGKPVDKWIELVKSKKFEKHSEIIRYLKENHGFTHGYANYISLKTRKADAHSADSGSELISNQYNGKENLKQIYDKLITEVLKLGNDITIAPKKANVSLRRKKQFALIQPSTKTRIDLGLKLKDTPIGGRLEDSGLFGTMCTHRIKINSLNEIDDELFSFIKTAYEKAN